MSLLDMARGWLEGLGLGTAALLRDSPDSASGLRAWLADEGWLAVPPELLQALASVERCTACEACNAVCPLLADANLAQFGGPMDLALRYGRMAPDLRLARRYLDAFTRCGACRRCERECPSQIPLRALADALRQVLDDNGVPPARAVGTRTEGSHDPG
jgi:succinate dehydrogenase/fumarate reductase-like Fe-S protein